MKNNYIKQKGDFDCLQTEVSNLLGIPHGEVPPFERHNAPKYGGQKGFEQGPFLGFAKAMEFIESRGFGSLLVEASTTDGTTVPRLGAKEYLCIGVLDVAENESHAVIVLVSANREMWLEHDPAEDEAKNLDELSHLLYVFNGGVVKPNDIVSGG